MNDSEKVFVEVAFIVQVIFSHNPFTVARTVHASKTHFETIYLKVLGPLSNPRAQYVEIEFWTEIRMQPVQQLNTLWQCVV